jgi:hypothetical protein
MRVDNSTSSPTSWIGLKEKGKAAFERAEYEAALTSYTAALHPDLYCPSAERQIILSNMVACRLKVGGTAQAEAAVETAKQVRNTNTNTNTVGVYCLFSFQRSFSHVSFVLVRCVK